MKESESQGEASSGAGGLKSAIVLLVSMAASFVAVTWLQLHICRKMYHTSMGYGDISSAFNWIVQMDVVVIALGAVLPVLVGKVKDSSRDGMWVLRSTSYGVAAGTLANLVVVGGFWFLAGVFHQG